MEHGNEEMVNKVLEIIENDSTICFVLNTQGEHDFWYWEVGRAVWDYFWRDKNPDVLKAKITNEAATEFVNSDECSHYGCSCGHFATVAEAIKDYFE